MIDVNSNNILIAVVLLLISYISRRIMAELILKRSPIPSPEHTPDNDKPDIKKRKVVASSTKNTRTRGRGWSKSRKDESSPPPIGTRRVTIPSAETPHPLAWAIKRPENPLFEEKTLMDLAAFLEKKAGEMGHVVMYEGALQLLRAIRMEILSAERQLSREMRQALRTAKGGRCKNEDKARRYFLDVINPITRMIDGEIEAHLGISGRMDGGELGWAQSRCKSGAFNILSLSRTSVEDTDYM